jgi:integrase
MGKRRRGSAKHKGVVLICRPVPGGAGLRWLARHRDPETGKKKETTIPAEHAATAELRTAWAVRFARDVEKRRAEVEGGAPTKTDATLEETIDVYFRDLAPLLRPATVKAYRLGTDALVTWAKGRRITLAAELRPTDLELFRAAMFKAPRQAQVAGEGRGARREAGDKRSPVSVNSRLRAVKTVLDALRRVGKVPMLTGDAIRDHLRAEKEPRPTPEYLKAAALARLVRAALRHDAERLSLTREEKARGVKPGHGSTPKYDPIAPYLAHVLLSGMRADEARLLRWHAVDLEAEPAGVIELRPEDTKTKHGRLVDLLVSPALRSLLRALKVRAGRAEFVFGGAEPYSRPKVEAARKRLVRDFGAPSFTWQQLRETCATFLANSSIFGAASAYREAKQLGHSVAVAERHYCGVVHVDPSVRTLEAAMGVSDELALAVRQAGGERLPAAALPALA